MEKYLIRVALANHEVSEIENDTAKLQNIYKYIRNYEKLYHFLQIGVIEPGLYGIETIKDVFINFTDQFPGYTFRIYYFYDMLNSYKCINIKYDKIIKITDNNATDFCIENEITHLINPHYQY
jgi:hypothetical protein